MTAPFGWVVCRYYWAELSWVLSEWNAWAQVAVVYDTAEAAQRAHPEATLEFEPSRRWLRIAPATEEQADAWVAYQAKREGLSP